MRLYLNGVLDNIKSNINIVIPQNVQNLSIGGMLDNGNLSYPVNGYIDDVRIYNFALTSQEIQDIYDQHCWATAIENEVQNVVKLFPNPASEMLQIEWNTIQPEKIAIIDFTGKIVLQKELETSKQNTNLDVSNLAKGMYLVKIVGKEGEYSQKFVKE